MLQKLNERIQGVVAWVVVILIAATFALFGVDYYMQSRQSADVEVEVNGQAISKQAFDLNYRRARQQLDPAQLTSAAEKQLKKQVLDEMIVNNLSVQSARLYGFDVTLSQANSAILSIPQFQEDGHFSTGRYQQALSGALFTPESFQKEVRQGMLLNQQRFAFIGTAFALPSEIQQFVKLYLQTRDYSYLLIPAAPFVKKIQVSPESVRQYYEQHPQQFRSPEQLRVAYVRLSMQDMKAKVHVSDDQIEAYYNENRDNYLTPAQWRVAHVLFAVPADASAAEEQQAKEKAEQAYASLLTNPAVFEQQVNELSDDKTSISNKGVLPWITAGQTEYDKVFVTLTKPGQISAPVRSSHGYEIFKLLAYQPASMKSFSEVKPDIQEQLTAELVQADYAKALEQLSDLSYQSPDSLKPVASALGLTIETTEPFSHKGGRSSVANNKQVVNAAFSHDVLELGNNSEPIQLDNDSIIVLRVAEHIPARVKQFAEVKSEIAEQLARKNAAMQAKVLGESILAASANEVQQNQLVTDNQLQWRTIAASPRDVAKTLEGVNAIAFQLARVGEQKGVLLASGDYVVVRLKKINDGQMSNMDNEQVASITQQIEANFGVMDYDLYVRNLLTKAAITHSS